MLDRKYERQMSGKEKRKFEAEKLSQMTLKEKIEYLWMYYKIYLLIPVILIVLICVGVQMYHGMTEKVLLNLMILDGNGTLDRTDLEEDITDALGSGKKNEVVKINANLSASSEDYNSNIALTTLVGAEAVDVMICPEETYRQYADQGGFMNLEDLIPEEELAGKTSEKDALILEKCSYLEQKIGVSYEPVYVCIMENAQNKENAAAFLEMLLKNVS
nr:hypothetical protein [uncultured Sellimonas sp.]